MMQTYFNLSYNSPDGVNLTNNSHSLIAERLSMRHPNSAAHSRFVMFVCQSRFRNSIIVMLRNSGQSVEESVRVHTSDNVHDPMT